MLYKNEGNIRMCFAIWSYIEENRCSFHELPFDGCCLSCSPNTANCVWPFSRCPRNDSLLLRESCHSIDCHTGDDRRSTRSKRSSRWKTTVFKLIIHKWFWIWKNFVHQRHNFSEVYLFGVADLLNEKFMSLCYRSRILKPKKVSRIRKFILFLWFEIFGTWTRKP